MAKDDNGQKLPDKTVCLSLRSAKSEENVIESVWGYTIIELIVVWLKTFVTQLVYMTLNNISYATFTLSLSATT